MTAKPASTQTETTRKAFDDWSGHWRNHYKDDGLMAGRVARFLEALGAPAAGGGRLLDFGCGTGDIAVAAANAGWQVDACDISARMIGACAARADGQPVAWRQLDAVLPLPLPFDDAVFDAVVSSSVFEYLEAPDAAIAEIARILKPGGRFVLTVPDPRHEVRRREARLARLAKCDPVWWIVRLTRWREMYRYLRISINRPALETWQDMLRSEGLVLGNIDPVGDPLALLIAKKRE